MKNTIKLLMCAVMALCFIGCTPDEEGAEKSILNVASKGNALFVTWKAVAGAVYYEIQLNDEEPQRHEETNCKFENLSYGTTYKVDWKAIGAGDAVLMGASKSITLKYPAYREWVGIPSAFVMSSNGNWVGCWNDHNGAIIDLTTGNHVITENFEVWDITNDGVAVGCDYSITQDGVAAIYINGASHPIDLSSITENNMMSNITAITADGTLAAGWYWNYDGEDAYWPSIYGDVVPFIYDIAKERVYVPEAGESPYPVNAMSIYDIAPDGTILGLEQSIAMINTIWKNKNSAYEYAYFNHDEKYNPTTGMGEMCNRFSASGRYIYGMAQDYTSGIQVNQPAIFDRETGELHLFEGIGSVSAMTDDGIVFINDAPYGWGTTTYVTTIDKKSMADYVTLEQWLVKKHKIDVSKYAPMTDTDDTNLTTLDGTITIGVSADGRRILAITNSLSGWVTSVIDLDGAK